MTERVTREGIDTTDLLDVICDGIEKRKLKPVFWVCPNRCCKGVTWDFSGDKPVATCDTCGKTSLTSNTED